MSGILPYLLRRQQDAEGDYTVFFICLSIFVLVVLIVNLAAIWKLLVKAGKPGWVSLVPLYNLAVLLKIIGRPWWYLVFLFIPGAQVVLYVVLTFGLSQSFGESWVFAIGLTLLLPILLPVLGFGKAQYVGPLGPSYR